MAKKLLALVLSVLMLVSLLPVSAMAYETNTVAVVGDVQFTSVSAAVAYVNDNDVADPTITLVADDHVSFAAGATITINKAMSIEGNGNVAIYGNRWDPTTPIGYEDPTSIQGFVVSGTGNVTFKNVTLTEFGDLYYCNKNFKPVSTDGFSGTLTLDGVTFSKFNRQAVTIESGNLVMTGCTVTCDANGPTGDFDHCQQGVGITGSASATISNTEINGVRMDTKYKDPYWASGIVSDSTGSVVVNNCTVTPGTQVAENSYHWGSVAVENDGTGSVTINGGSYTSDINPAIYNKGTGTMTISDGVFSTDPTDTLSDAYVAVKRADGYHVEAAYEAGCGYAVKAIAGGFEIGDPSGVYEIKTANVLGLKILTADMVSNLAVAVKGHFNEINSVELIAVYAATSDTNVFTVSPALAAKGASGQLGISETFDAVNTDPDSGWSYDLTVPYEAADGNKLKWTLTSDIGAGTATGTTTVADNAATVRIPHFSTLTLSPSTVYIRYHANNGDGSVTKNASFEYGDGYVALTPEAAGMSAPTGKFFNGWSADRNSTTAEYAAGENISERFATAGTSDAPNILYAIWGNKPVAITYYLVDPDTKTVVTTVDPYAESTSFNTAYTLKAFGDIPASYNWTQPDSTKWTLPTTEAWNTAINGTGTPYSAGTLITATADLTLYTQWKAVATEPTYPITVTVDPAGAGTYSITADAATAGTLINVTAAANTGYTFDSFAVTKAGMGGVATESVGTDGIKFAMEAEPVNVTVKFTQNKYTATLATGLENGSISADKTSDLVYGEVITVTATPTSANYKVGEVTYTLDSDTSETPTKYSATLDGDDYKIGMPADSIHVTATFVASGNAVQVGTNYYTADQFANAVTDAISTGNKVVLIDDVSMTAMVSIPASKSVTINLNNHTLTAPSASKAFEVEGTLTLTDESTEKNGVLNGNGQVNDGTSGGIIALSNTGSANGTFIMNGGKLTGGNTAHNGGAVYAPANTTFTMNGGEITGNTAATGNNVYVDSNAAVTIAGTAKLESVYLAGNAIVALDGTPEIADVYLSNGAKLAVASTLDNSTPICVTMANVGEFTTGGNGATKLDKFTSGNPGYIVRESGNEAQLIAKIVVKVDDDSEPITLTLGTNTSTEYIYAIATDTVEVEVAAPAAGQHLDTVTVTTGATLAPDGTAYKLTFDTSTPPTEVTVKAAYAVNTYTVKFDANGGDGTMADQEFTYGTAQALTANAFTKTGYVFDGWATAADGDVVYTEPYNTSSGELATNDGATVTLFAHWAPVSYDVEFDGNGSTGGSTAKKTGVKYDEEITLTNGFVKDGYAFVGWAKSASATTPDYDDVTAYKNLSDTNATVTLFAMWKALPRTLHIVYNGGTWEGNTTYDVTYDTDATVDLSAAWFQPENAGQTLTGWVIDGESNIYHVSFKMPAAEMTNLVAQWTIGTTYSVTYNPGEGGGTEHKVSGIASGSKETLPAATYFTAPANKYFAGWKEASGDVKAANAEVVVNSDLVYTAQWADNPTLTPDSSHGAVTFSPAAQNAAGTNVTATVTPNPGWKIDTVTVVPTTGSAVTPTEVEGKYSFAMTESSATFKVTYTAKQYDIIVPGTDANGNKVTANKTKATVEEDVDVTFTPAEGYKVTAATVEGADILSYISSGTYTIDMDVFVTDATTAITVAATFEKIGYTVTATAPDGNGTVSVDPTDANYGDPITVTTTPEIGYELDYVTVNDTKITMSGNEDTFSMPNGNAEVKAYFKQSEYTITGYDVTGEGTVQPNVSTAHYGDPITLTVTPAEGKALSSITAVYAGNKDVTVTDKQFTMPAGNVTVTATFTNGVAAIGSTYYLTLDAAFEAAQNGDKIVLLADVTGNYSSTKNITLDLNGNTVTAAETSAPAFVISSGSFTLEGEGQIKSGTTGEGIGVTVPASATFNMYGGEITGFATGVDVDASGKITMHGTPKVTGNKNANVNLKGGQIKIDGELSADARIGVTGTTDTYQITSGYGGYTHGAEPATIFSSDAGKYIQKNSSNEVIITPDSLNVTLNGDGISNIYINGSDANPVSVAAGNTVTLTLKDRPEGKYLKGFEVKYGNTPVNVTMTVNPADGTFSGATFTMPGGAVTVTPIWADETDAAKIVIDAAKKVKEEGGRVSRGVFLGNEDGLNVDYTIQVKRIDDETNNVQTIRDDISALTATISKTNAAQTLVLKTDQGYVTFNKSATGWAFAKSTDSRVTSGNLKAAINATTTFTTATTETPDYAVKVNLVLNGVPTTIAFFVKDEVTEIPNGAKIKSGYLGADTKPDVIVTPVTVDETALQNAIDAAYPGMYTLVSGNVNNVDVYYNSQLVSPVELNENIKFRLAVSDGTYFVGYYHDGAYQVLDDAVTATGGYGEIAGKEFSPYFFLTPAQHNITYVADATQGEFTTAPATANYGAAVDIVVAAKTGYHLTDLYYYETGADASTATHIFVDGQTDYTIASMPAYDITVDAEFAGNEYTVRLFPTTDGSYDETPKTVKVTYGKPYNLNGDLPKPTSSLTFDHWVLKDSDPAQVIDESAAVAIAADHTLEAVYVGTYVTLTYDANAPAGTHAVGTIAAQHATAGESVPLAAGSGYTIVSDTNPSRTYTFVCWTNANGDPVTGTDFVLNHDTTLYAKWEYDVSLTYEANAPAAQIKTAMPSNQTGKNGMKVTIANAIQREGYQFVSWSTDKNDTDLSARIPAGQTNYVVNDDVTLYAIWKENSAYQCIVYFDTDGGTAISPIVFDYTSGDPTPQALPTTNDTTKEHYTLVKWHQQAYGIAGDVAVFDPGAVFTPTAGKTYTMVAEWKEDDKAEITYVLPAGVNGTKPDDAYAYVGDTYVPSATKFTKADQHTTYTHDGWVTAEGDMFVEATTVYNSSNPYKVTNTNKITFYPHFAVVPEGMHTITFDLAASDASWKTGSAFASGAYTNYQDVTFALPTNDDVARTGWVLDGWEDTPNSTTYRTTQKYTIGASNATLTAVWKKEAKNAEITTTQEQIATGTYSFYYTQKLDARTDLGSTYESINEFFYEAIDTSNVHEQTSSKLPDGLKLSEDGIISGIPTKAGEFHFYVGMRDAEKQPLKTKLPDDTSEITSVKEFVIVINPLDVQVDLGITTPFAITYGEDDPTDLKYTSNLAFYAKNTSGDYVLVGDTATDLGSGNYVAYSVSGDTVKLTFTNTNTTGVPGPDNLVFQVTCTSDQNKSTAGKTKVGSYLLDVTLPSNPNYTFAKAKDWTNAAKNSKYFYVVNKKDATAAWTNPAEGYMYTSLPIFPTADVSSYIVVNDTDPSVKDILTVGYNYDGPTTDGQPINVGSYTANAYLTGADADNYNLLAAAKPFEIVQREKGPDAYGYEVKIAPDALQNKTFNGEPQEPIVTVGLYKNGTLIYTLDQDVDYKLTYDTIASTNAALKDGKPYNAGYYDVHMTGIGNFNFSNDWTYTGTVGGFRIAPANNNITLSIVKSSIVYGTELKSPDVYKVDADFGADTAILHWYSSPPEGSSGTELGAPPKDVGTYYLTAEIPASPDGNYEKSQVTPYATFDITAKPFPVVWDPTDASFEYNGAARNFTAVIDPAYVVSGDTLDNGRLPKLDVTYKDENGDYVAAADVKSAGTYTATAVISSGSNVPANYELLTTEPTATKEFEITPKSIADAAVTIDPKTAVYAAAELNADAYVTVTDTAVSVAPLVLGTDYEITWEGAKGGTYLIDADVYTATITGKGNFNGYQVVSDTFTITPAPVTVTWTEVPQVYVDNNGTWTYTYGDAINPTPILDGVIGSDDCTAIASIYDGTSDTVSATPYCVGQHTAKAFLTGEKADNYKIDPVNDLSIFVNKLKIKVTLQDNYKIFGDADPVPLSTFTTNAPNVNFAYEITRDADFGEDVGNHAIKFVITSMATSNYELDDTSKTTAILTINPKSIAGAEISFDPTSAYYTGTDTDFPTVTVKLDGYTISADAGYEVKWTWGVNPVTEYKDGGVYTVKVTGKNNYDGEQVGTATFTVYPVAPTVNTKPTSKGTVETSGSAVELINPGTATGGIMMYSLDGGEFKSETPKSSAVGTHTVTWKVKGTAPNYYDIDGDTTLTVEVKQSSSPTPTPTPTPTPGPGGKEYNLKLAATTDGTLSFNNKHITDNPHSFPAGTKVTIDVVPASYYRVERVTYSYTKDGKTVEKELPADANGAYILEMPSADTVVTATFVPKNNNDPSVGKVTIENYTNGYVDCDHTDESCPLATFEDLKDNLEAWYHDGIHYCLENGIMQGFGTPFFLPDDYTTRAQVVTTLWNIAGNPIAKSDVVFDDVKEDDWFYDAIMWAAANHIVNGYGDGNFGPNDLITHEQVAKIFYGYAAFYGFDVTPTTDISGMPGANTVHEWALPYVQWGVATRLCCGVDGNVSLIAATANVTRAELATTILNFCTRVATKPAQQ